MTTTREKRRQAAAAVLDSPQISALFDKVRLTDEPLAPPEPKRPLFTASRLATMGLAVVCTLTWWCYAGSRSPWIGVTASGGIDADSVVIGNTSVYNGDFFHNANFAALEQIEFIKGTQWYNVGQQAASLSSGFRDPRIGYGVLGNLFTAVFTSYYALWTLNLALYYFCALIVGRTSRILFEDPTKTVLASTLFVLSVAVTTHVGDLSPHFLSLTFFYVLTYLLIRTELDEKRSGWRRTIGLAGLLGAWSLVDVSSFVGLAVCVVFLLRRRYVLHAALSALTWYVAPQLQSMTVAYLGLGQSTGTGHAVLWHALQMHWSQLRIDPFHHFAFLAVQAVNCLVNDNPLNVLVGVFGLCFLRHRAKWLLGVCYLVPIAVSLVLVPVTAERGSAVAGNTIVLFLIASHFGLTAGRWLRERFGANWGAVPVGVLLAAQLVWGQAELVNWRFPGSTYVAGIVHEATAVRPVEFARMTGLVNEKPTTLGGRVPAPAYCGLAEGFGKQPVLPVERLEPHKRNWDGMDRMLVGLGIQALVAGFLLIAAFGLLRLRFAILFAFGFTAWIATAQICGAATAFDRNTVRSFNSRIHVDEDEKVFARIPLSAAFRERFIQALQSNREIECVCHLQPSSETAALSAEFQVYEWTTDGERLTIPSQSFAEALAAHEGCVEFSISPTNGSKGLYAHSWQAIGTTKDRVSRPRYAEGREAFLIRADGTRVPISWFPSFEIRVVDAHPLLPLNASLAQYEERQPTGYVLIGF